MSICISKRTTVAFAYAYAFAYAQPYCAKNFIFCTNKHEHKQQSAALNRQKIWANIMPKRVVTLNINETFRQ
jgi:hypothetical protein